MEMDMDDRDLRILKAFRETRNVTKAAQSLYISQPAVTARLKNIEKEYGQKLFYMERKRLYFTPAGELLARYAAETLIKEQEARDAILNAGSEAQRGLVRIGASDAYAYYKLAPLLQGFSKKYPDISVTLKSGSSRDVVNMLSEGKVHVGICNIGASWQGEKTVLSQDYISICSSKPVDLERLSETPMIHYAQNDVLREIIDDWWMENYTSRPNIVMEVQYINTALEMVRHGFGYCIAPEIYLGGKGEFYLTRLKKPKGEFIIRTCWLRYHLKQLEFPAVKTFINFVNEFFPSRA
jgi:DNA-binding transcriptional LysR family regulator